METEERIIQTQKGRFHLKYIAFRNRNSGLIESYTLFLGGPKQKCIEIQIPSPEMSKKVGLLMTVKNKDDCFLEKTMDSKSTQHMVFLGIKIARLLNPTLERLNLDDTSSFECLLPSGKEQIVPMKQFHIAFYGATWYEYYFGAKKQKRHADYVRQKERLSDPSFKPADWYYFTTDELTEVLYPIYERTRTWREFFDAISQTYGKKKCALIYPWIDHAFLRIFDNNSVYEDKDWCITFSDPDFKQREEDIEFKAYEVQRGGARRRTIKKRKVYVYRSYEHLDIYPRGVENWDLRKFLRG